MGRNSFVFYKDWRDAIKDLPNDIRLEIYDSIAEYAFSGEIPTLKPMASIAFNFIKGDLDRNLERYQEVRNKKSESGRLGNLKRWNEDLFHEVNQGKITLDEAEKIAKYRTATNEIAKIAINVNDNDNDNDNDLKEIDTNVSTKKEADASSFPSTDYEIFRDWMGKNAPYCNNPKNFKKSTISEEEFIKLKAQYTSEQIADTILQIENRKDLRKRYVDLYLTVLNWIKNDERDKQ